MVDPEFVVYADGASRKDGRGGWGWTLSCDAGTFSACGGAYDTTNNRMELMGVIEALCEIGTCAEPGERLRIHVWSDSQYVIKGISEYIDGWRQRRWRTSGNKPVKNQDLWERLYLLKNRHDIEWKWVKGHTGNIGNERADRLAAQGVPLPRERESGADAPPARVPLRRRTVQQRSTYGASQDQRRGQVRSSSL